MDEHKKAESFLLRSIFTYLFIVTSMVWLGQFALNNGKAIEALILYFTGIVVSVIHLVGSRKYTKILNKDDPPVI